MEKSTQNQSRQIAYKTKIKDILEGEYIKEDGWIPNYILSGTKKISRVNLVGVVVAKSDNSENQEFVLEDKSGKISVRFFEKKDSFGVWGIGDFLRIIGRPREYNGQKYIVPEIIKNVEKGWFELMMFEVCGALGIQKKTPEIKKKQEIIEKKIMEDIIKDKINSEDVIGFIKKLDVGDGADYEEVLLQAKDDKILKNLLEEGEIFEIRPGKLKVL
ncbi:hypothetical protein ISS04_00080 [Candidatus Woesearchaeota archaeon]|nr:hypothetical protein [Candidatus Woesearchaeota archaeon]